MFTFEANMLTLKEDDTITVRVNITHRGIILRGGRTSSQWEKPT